MTTDPKEGFLLAINQTLARQLLAAPQELTLIRQPTAGKHYLHVHDGTERQRKMHRIDNQANAASSSPSSLYCDVKMERQLDEASRLLCSDDAIRLALPSPDRDAWPPIEVVEEAVERRSAALLAAAQGAPATLRQNQRLIAELRGSVRLVKADWSRCGIYELESLPLAAPQLVATNDRSGISTEPHSSGDSHEAEGTVYTARLDPVSLVQHSYTLVMTPPQLHSLESFIGAASSSSAGAKPPVFRSKADWKGLFESDFDALAEEHHRGSATRSVPIFSTVRTLIEKRGISFHECMRLLASSKRLRVKTGVFVTRLVFEKTYEVFLHSSQVPVGAFPTCLDPDARVDFDDAFRMKCKSRFEAEMSKGNVVVRRVDDTQNLAGCEEVCAGVWLRDAQQQQQRSTTAATAMSDATTYVFHGYRFDHGQADLDFYLRAAFPSSSSTQQPEIDFIRMNEAIDVKLGTTMQQLQQRQRRDGAQAQAAGVATAAAPATATATATATANSSSATGGDARGQHAQSIRGRADNVVARVLGELGGSANVGQLKQHIELLGVSDREIKEQLKTCSKYNRVSKQYDRIL